MNSQFDKSLRALILWISLLVALAFAIATALGQSLNEPEVTQPELSDQERRSAVSWGLTETEWRRHRELRSLRKGLVSADVTPLEILGIFSASDTERKRYARLYARQQLDLLERIAMFEADYLEAVRELTHSASGTTGRYKLVAAVGCATSQCAEQLQRALQLADPHGLDIFLTGTAGNDGTVRSWAARNNIPPDAVRSRRITLNHAQPGMKKGLYQ